MPGPRPAPPLQLLPGGREDAEAKLHKVREELSQLEPLHRAAEKAAHRLTDRILAAGGCLLFVQLVAFIYLTWFELSWDVMEPVRGRHAFGGGLHGGLSWPAGQELTL